MTTKDTSVQETIIYPGLYAPSGYDMMSILVCSLASAGVASNAFLWTSN